MTALCMRLWVWLNDRDDRDEGATMVEYALLVLGVTLVAFVAVVLIGPKLSDAYNSVANAITG